MSEVQKRYEQEFTKLNAAQKRAVETIDGPVLVIAGPGTGKTQLLSMRVAHILYSSDADAQNILCLTFTNKAAVNMRERLQRLIGPDSNKVVVKTFHGFAAELMNQYSDYFWSGARLSTAPDAIQLEIVQTLLAKLPLSNPLSIRFAGQYTATDDVLQALRLSKEAGLTPDKLRAIIEANLRYIDVIEPELIDALSQTLSAKRVPALEESIQNLTPQGIDEAIAPLVSLTTVIQDSLRAAIEADGDSGKTKHVSRWKARWLQTQDGAKGLFDERRRNEWWLAFCDVYSLYRNQLHERGFYDYADMLLEVISQLEQQPDLRAAVQERFQYVLIDEFQDSNAAQLRLSHLIANHHSAEGNPNIMAVGDDDQSIFGFNGAELKNMLFFEQTYQSVTSIILTDNYRSSQAILDTTEKIIDQASDRLVNRLPNVTKKLQAQNEPTKPGTIEHISYETQDHQVSLLARQLAVDHKTAQTNQESIAVLARSHESLRRIAGILRELNVPIKYEQQSNILEHVIVKQITLVAASLVAIEEGDKSTANHAISQLIQHPAWGFTNDELWQLARNNYSQPDWFLSLTSSDQTKQKQLGEWLGWLAREATYQPLEVVCEHILGLRSGTHMTSPLREYFISTDRAYAASQNIKQDYIHSLSAIRLLQALVREFAASEEASLADFVRFIEVNRDNGRGITDESTFVTEKGAIELYTVHKAKGLEFDRVFIIDAVEDNWRPRRSGRKPPANLPLLPPGEQEDDYIRLLYVAATRAKRDLIVCSFRFNQAGKEVLATPYILNAMTSRNVTQDTDIATQSDQVILEDSIKWPQLTTADDKAHLQPLLANYQLSATHLLDFLDVSRGGPQYFLQRHLLRLPEAKTATQAYGSAVHRALQYAQELLNKNQTVDVPKIVDCYQKELLRQHIARSEYEKYLEHGTHVLTNLFASKDFVLTHGAKAEQQLNSVSVGQAIIKGIVDSLAETKDEIIVTDYKSGQPLASFTTRDQTKAVKAWRHRSQLVFYAMLLKHSPHYTSNQEIIGRVIYIEAENQAKDLIKTYAPSSEEIARMEQLTEAVWAQVMSLDFSDTSKLSPDIHGITTFENDLVAALA